jgi:hypothetical protein
LEDNIKMDIRGIEWQCVDLMHLTQDRDPWWAIVKNGNEASVSMEVGKFLD